MSYLSTDLKNLKIEVFTALLMIFEREREIGKSNEFWHAKWKHPFSKVEKFKATIITSRNKEIHLWSWLEIYLYTSIYPQAE